MATHLPPDTDREQFAQLVVAAKEQLRQRVAALRRAVPPEARAERAHAACQRLWSEPALAGPGAVCVYACMRFELNVSEITERLWSEGREVCLPRVVAGTGALVLHRYAAGDVLEENEFSVREPAESSPEVQATDVSCILVPGLAFDESGYRLGFGKGFFDRLLPRMPQATAIGVGFDFQLLAEVPHAEHDARMQRFVSDRRTLACP